MSALAPKSLFFFLEILTMNNSYVNVPWAYCSDVIFNAKKAKHPLRSLTCL